MFLNIFKTGAVSDMHQRGFTNDFHLFGNNLFWVQEKIFIRADGFSFIECHRFPATRQIGRDIIFFGVFLREYNVKGILINDYAKFIRHPPEVISKKLSELTIKTKQYAKF